MASRTVRGSIHRWGSSAPGAWSGSSGSAPSPDPTRRIVTWSLATKRFTPAASAWANALAIPPSSPRPFSTRRSAFVSVSMSFAEGSHSWGSAPLGMRT